MYKFEHKPLERFEYGPGSMALFFLITFIIGFILSNTIALLFMPDLDMNQAQNPAFSFVIDDSNRTNFLLMQGVSNFIWMGVAPFIFLKLIAKRDLNSLKRAHSKHHWIGYITVILIFLFSGAMYSFIMELNQKMDFGEWLNDFSKQLQEFTISMTQFQNTGELLLAVLVIAIIPAFCEEFAFRGIFQGILIRWFGNHHIAIIVSGIVFSAIHMQFDGLFARALLGISFGYIYYWTGKLWYSIFAHFINNFAAIILLHLINSGSIEGDPETFGNMGAMVALASMAVTVGLHYLIYRNQDKFLTSTPINHDRKQEEYV